MNKTEALLFEHNHRSNRKINVVSHIPNSEYVIGRSGLCMQWEQPIPGSHKWIVKYLGKLSEGVFMTHRERAEVDEMNRTET